MLVDNINAFLDLVKRCRPLSTKGTYMRKVALAATMSPSVLVDVG